METRSLWMLLLSSWVILLENLFDKKPEGFRSSGWSALWQFQGAIICIIRTILKKNVRKKNINNSQYRHWCGCAVLNLSTHDKWESRQPNVSHSHFWTEKYLEVLEKKSQWYVELFCANLQNTFPTCWSFIPLHAECHGSVFQITPTVTPNNESTWEILKCQKKRVKALFLPEKKTLERITLANCRLCFFIASRQSSAEANRTCTAFSKGFDVQGSRCLDNTRDSELFRRRACIYNEYLHRTNTGTQSEIKPEVEFWLYEITYT